MFDQLLAYLSNINLLCITEFGVGPGHSTELSALGLVDHLKALMDMYNVHINIYIDLSKALDTLDHSILLSKQNIMVLLIVLVHITFKVVN